MIRKRRLKTVATILSCAIFFDEVVGSRMMSDMLTLLAGLAVDASTDDLYNIVTPIVVDAARDPTSWEMLERVFPDLCRLIELDDATSAS